MVAAGHPVRTVTDDHRQLAHANVARLRAPIDAPEMTTLVRALADVNWLAERSPGFVWRHRADPEPLTAVHIPGIGEVVITVSVWRDYESLHQYVYRTAHALFMQRRARWYVPVRGGLTTVLWWVPAGHEPSVDEAVGRLLDLRTRGSTVQAFSLRHQFGPDGSPRSRETSGPRR
jgi:hypothetical protein